jgi:hypothetical protein
MARTGKFETDFPSLKSFWISFLLFNFSFLFKVNLGLMGKLLKDEKTNLK